MFVTPVKSDRYWKCCLQYGFIMLPVSYHHVIIPRFGNGSISQYYCAHLTGYINVGI